MDIKTRELLSVELTAQPTAKWVNHVVQGELIERDALAGIIMDLNKSRLKNQIGTPWATCQIPWLSPAAVFQVDSTIPAQQLHEKMQSKTSLSFHFEISDILPFLIRIRLEFL